MAQGDVCQDCGMLPGSWLQVHARHPTDPFGYTLLFLGQAHIEVALASTELELRLRAHLQSPQPCFATVVGAKRLLETHDSGNAFSRNIAFAKVLLALSIAVPRRVLFLIVPVALPCWHPEPLVCIGFCFTPRAREWKICVSLCHMQVVSFPTTLPTDPIPHTVSGLLPV